MRRAWAFLRSGLDDPAIRYAIKFGLTGMLAVFIALVIRTPMPTWALFTVFVLMIAQYVGAIAEKSIFRIIGTIIGGLLGYLLTASLQQTPVVFLALVGLIVGFCTMMFGQNRYPYAFLLCGMTIVVVTSNGLGNPDMSWEYTMFRVEEVSVGILSAILVQSVLWPRYARVEFSHNARAAFADLQECFRNSGRIFLNGGNAQATEHAEDFPARITALRMLLDFGGRESQYFQRRLPTYFEITNCLGRIACAVMTLDKPLPDGGYYQKAIRREAEELHEALAASLGELANKSATPASRQAHCEAVKKAFQTLEDRLIALRQDPVIFSLPPEESTTLGLHILALDEIRQQIHRAHELLDSLPTEMGDPGPKETEPFVSSRPSPFWVRSGIKTGLAVIIALVLEDWLNPPGSTMFVLGSFVFTALNASSPGAQGDRRAFHFAAYNIIVLIGVSLLLILISPMLSSYAVMNTIIFTWLFVWGYLTYNTHGVTMPMQMTMMMMIGILSLNGQEPVPFQSIVQFFFGLALAALLAALVQRLLWPSLPQWELRDRFLEFLQTCRTVLAQGAQKVPLWQRTRLALIPGEAGSRIGNLLPPICPADEPGQLRAYLRILQRVGAHLTVSAGRLAPLLPPEQARRGQELIAAYEGELEKQIRAHEAGIKNTALFAPDSTELSQKIGNLKAWLAELRAWLITQNHPPLEIIRILGLTGRYEEAGQDLLKANAQAARLRLPLYMGDYVL